MSNFDYQSSPFIIFPTNFPNEKCGFDIPIYHLLGLWRKVGCILSTPPQLNFSQNISRELYLLLLLLCDAAQKARVLARFYDYKPHSQVENLPRYNCCILLLGDFYLESMTNFVTPCLLRINKVYGSSLQSFPTSFV